MDKQSEVKIETIKIPLDKFSNNQFKPIHIKIIRYIIIYVSHAKRIFFPLSVSAIPLVVQFIVLHCQHCKQ